MNSILKKIFKTILILIGLIVIALVIAYFILDKPLPKGENSVAADLLAQQMLTAINYDTFKETSYLEWSFSGGSHHFIWDKENGQVTVKWSDYTVHLNLKNPNESAVFEKNKAVKGDSKTHLINKATAYFNNDSFWLLAPFKVFDEGSKRTIVTLEDGTKSLLVTYTSGGTTPGDSYLWKLQPNGFPESYQMWVKIIPIGGLEASWDDWKVMENGLFLPATHKIGPITLYMRNVRAYN
tara:strand:+ start:9047 stop:9760 length:714 start_codon:yes stop_codon:yes gene_type:complete